MLTALAILLHCHSTSMNMDATINSIILRRGGADKMTFKRFNHIALCLSYSSSLKLQSELGKKNLSVVKEWTKASVIKAVSPEGYIPVSPPEVVHARNDPGTAAELVSNTGICEASPSEKGHQTQPVHELSQVTTNMSTGASATPRELPIHDVDYVLAGDNVNLSIKTRYTSRKKLTSK